MHPDEVVQRGQREVGRPVAEVPVDVADADELLDLLPLLTAAHVVQQARDVVQRRVREDLCTFMGDFE